MYKGEDGSLVVQVFLDSFDKNDWENCEVTFVNVGTTKVEMEKDSFLEFLFPDGSSYKFVLSEFSLLPGERRLMKADAKYKGTINTENHLKVGVVTIATLIELFSDEITLSGSKMLEDFVTVSYSHGGTKIGLYAWYQ